MSGYRRVVPLLVIAIASIAPAACVGENAEEPPARAAEAGPAPAGEPSDPARLLPNGLMPFEEILVGGQPTPEQLAAARDLGYRTVINTRHPDERGSTRPQDVEALGMAYVSIPIVGAEGVSEETARRLADALEAAEPPVIVHCTSGNRVGAIFAMIARFVDGETPEQALAIGKAAGLTGLEPLVREKLGLPAQPD